MRHHHLLLPAGLAAAALAAVPASAEGAILKSAGWHGREIRAPHVRFADLPTPRFPRGWSAGEVARGTGSAKPSQRVRDLQRRLRGRGYRPGPVDGRFGPRTRSAVLWFQIKHGLPRTGRGDALTITRLRAPQRSPQPMTAAPAVAAMVVPAQTDALDPVALLLLAVVMLAGLTAIAVWVRGALRRRPEAAPPPPDTSGASAIPQVIGYLALEPDADLDAGAGAIRAWCEARGWPLTKVVHDVLSARGRPGLGHALGEIRAGRASGLVVDRLRNLTGSLTDLGPLLQWFVDEEAFVIALDYELDTSSDDGELAARALVEVSAWERGRVEARTRPGRDATPRGAAVRDDPGLASRIRAMRDSGMSLQAIADALNEAGVPTLRGGTRWRPSSVQAATGYKRPSPRFPNP